MWLISRLVFFGLAAFLLFLVWSIWNNPDAVAPVLDVLKEHNPLADQPNGN